MLFGAPGSASGIERLTFTGRGSEYFRIWIVNLALTIATLGIYSAWAKVRRLQYFYRHTRLAGSGFDYHADPVAILKGRMVGLLLLALYMSIGYVQLGVSLAIVVALGLCVPWLLSRSLKFRLASSSFRGIRFRFHGATRSAYWVFLGLAFLTMLSLFTLSPFWHHRMKRYQFGHAAYGRTRASFDAKVGDFYVAYVLAGAAFVVAILIVIVTLTVVLAVLNVQGRLGEEGAGLLGIAIVLAAYMPAIVLVQAIVGARVQNAVWNGTSVGGHRFICDVSILRLFWIRLTNLLGTVCTLGLYRPFGQVRLAAYLTSVLVLLPYGSLDDLAADEAAGVSAVGEEAAGFFDLDLGL